MDDQQAHWVEKIRHAQQHASPLALIGSGTKRFLYRNAPSLPESQTLDTRAHRGILDYQPSELVITARSGTPLLEIEQELAEKKQCLSFEPPNFDQQSTLGGTIASGLSGPASPWRGRARDHVLGVRLINGQAETLRFGGTVIKNVAGYDLSRLNCGAFGRFGALLDISLRVQPQDRLTQSYSLAQSLDQAHRLFARLRQQALPVSAAMHLEERTYLRLSGQHAEVQKLAHELKARIDDNGIWAQINQLKHPFFSARSKARLWRINLPANHPPLAIERGESLVDWAGQQRWLWSEQPEALFRQQLPRSACAWVIAGPAERIAQPLTAPQQALSERIYRAFDPAQIFSSHQP